MTDDGQCYEGCPHPPCVTIRAARPDPPVPLSYWPCCSAIVRLTRTGPDTYTGTTQHLDHCTRGGFLLPENKETT